jgi:hypothetical protein
MYKYSDKNLGEFTESTQGCSFTYQPVDPEWQWAVQHNLPHQIHVLDGFRAGLVLKTVAYICVDEAADGTPVLEKWSIKKHIKFPI